MKMSFIILLLSVITSCGNANHTSVAKNPPAPKQEVHQPPTIQQGMILGEFHKEDLQKEPYSTWFQTGYDSYTPDEEAMETIDKNIGDYKIIAFMGTWCHDSKREVPKMFKILDKAGYDLSNLTIYGVDYSKTTPNKENEKYDIFRVPTFIFIKDGKEVNRFVEHPRESLAKDIAKIVSGEPYKNSYAK